MKNVNKKFLSLVTIIFFSFLNNTYAVEFRGVGSETYSGVKTTKKINSTLENGAYTTTVSGLDRKLTLGLMGDRPSGARVIKLLKDAKSGTGINTNAVGGYVAPKKSFIYVPNTMLGRGKKQSRKRRKHKLFFII